MSEEKNKKVQDGTTISRRSFIKGVGTGVVAATVAPASLVEKTEAQQSMNELPGVTEAAITLNINKQNYKVKVESRTTLLSVLRDGIDANGERIDLTGTKQVCDRGECGGCTVLMDGKAVYSCMILALDAQGKEITTIESLADGDKLHPIQEAFVEHDALQCGFCTPGFVMSAKALLDENPDPTLEEIKHGLAGNLCRCGAYPRIFEAVQTAAKRMRKP
ncbi:(2Fe-2S)-binding protein [Candidatus Poribacteria bacterium]|nr:(2Fe-2S)-binding protein [Candidatus Poribacteria bacterium]